MKIIIEGPDGAGKSTLARQLSNYFGFPIQHRSKPNSEEEKQKMFDDYIYQAKWPSNIIYDRFLYSEMVYGNIMRDASVITTEQMYEVEHILSETGGLVIFCDNNLENLWKECTERGEAYILQKDTLSKIQTAYRNLMLRDTHLIPVFKYEIDYGTYLR